MAVSIWHNNDAENSTERFSYRGTQSGKVDRIYIVPEGDDYNWGFRGFETELEPPFYVIYATYTTGDTFGSNFDARIVGVCKEFAEATELMDEAENFTGYGELSNGFYVPWTGYFESLKSLDVEYVSGGLRASRRY